MTDLLARIAPLFKVRRNDVRHAIRVSAACGATFAFMRLLNIPGGQWAVFTTVIIMQGTVGSTLNQAVERLIGTMVGAIAGSVAVYAQERSGADAALVLVILVALVAFMAASRPALRAAPVTAVIMLVAHPVGMTPAAAAVFRIGEIFLGGIVGVAATLLIFPTHAHTAVMTRLNSVLVQLEAILASHAARLTLGGADESAMDIYLTNRASLATLQTAMADAARESASRLGANRHTEATPRAIWRLRNDLVSLGRTLNQPLAVEAMITPGQTVLMAFGLFLASCRANLSGGPHPDRVAAAKAHSDFQTAVELLRGQGVMRGIPFDDLAQTFAFVFAIEALYTNLSDLTDRLQEAQEDR